jgi:competence protein ComEA
MFNKFALALAGFFASIGIAFAAVDVNTADKAALDSIKGIGPATADKILIERKKGSFKDWDDLVKRVDGVGEKNAAGMSGAGLTVGGKSFSGAAPKAADKATDTAKDKPMADKGKDAKPMAAADTKAAPKADAKADAKADKPTKAEMKAQAKKEKAEKAAAEKAEKAAAAKAPKADKVADKPSKEAASKDAAKEDKPKK